MDDKTDSVLIDIDKDGDLTPKQKRVFIKMLARFIRCALLCRILSSIQTKQKKIHLNLVQPVWNLNL